MKKYLIAALAAVAVFAISAFAASLTVNAGTLQAGEDQIGQCTTADVDVAYGAPEFVGGTWVVDELTLDHHGDCEGLSYSVAVVSSTASWSTTPTQSGVFGAGAATVEFTAPFPAGEATDVHLAIRNAS